MAIEGCAKCVLIFFNIWFAIVGFILLAVGAVIKIGWSYLYGFISPVLDGVLSSLPSQAGSAVSSGTNATSAAVTSAQNLLDSLGITSIIEGASTTFIVLGVFLFFVGCMGCCGACCKVKIMLAIYAIIVGLFIVAEVIGVICFVAMKPQTEAALKQGLNTTIQKQYGGSTAFDGPSLGLNFVMVQFKCCGIDSYTEFYAAEKWNRNITLNINGNNVTIIQDTPGTCCKLNGTFPSVTPIDANCTVNPTANNSNYKTGCYNVVESAVQQYIMYVGLAIGGVGLIEIIMFAFAVILLVKNNKVDSV